MRKIIFLFLMLLLWPGIMGAEEAPLYEAVTRWEVPLRREKESSEWMKKVPGYSYVTVYEYDLEFCRIQYCPQSRPLLFSADLPQANNETHRRASIRHYRFLCRLMRYRLNEF